MTPFGVYLLIATSEQDFPGGPVVKNLPANAGGSRDAGSIPELGKSHAVVNGNLVFMPGKFQRRLAGYCPCGCKELDMTEHA